MRAVILMVWVSEWHVTQKCEANEWSDMWEMWGRCGRKWQTCWLVLTGAQSESWDVQGTSQRETTGGHCKLTPSTHAGRDRQAQCMVHAIPNERSKVDKMRLSWKWRRCTMLSYQKLFYCNAHEYVSTYKMAIVHECTCLYLLDCTRPEFERCSWHWGRQFNWWWP